MLTCFRTPVGVRLSFLTAICFLASGASAVAENVTGDSMAESGSPSNSVAVRAPVSELIASIEEPGLRSLIDEVLARNPDLLAARAEAEAAEAALDQISWPDPVAGAILYLAPPETRVGAQRLMITLSQSIPWFGKLDLEDRAAVARVTGARSRIEAHRLKLVTQTRRLTIELAFLAEQRRITMEFRDHLIRHEELARSRYSTGLGQGQGVVKMQAEITRAESELLRLKTRSRSLQARLNALRNVGATEPLPIDDSVLFESREVSGDLAALADLAVDRRPELSAARAAILSAEARSELAARQIRPDVTVGLTYALVERRDDPAARASPPPGNGDDVFGLTSSVRLPWLPHSRSRIAAQVGEAEALGSAARSRLAAVEREVRAEVDDLVQRLPLLDQQVDLIGDLLILQAEESLHSAEAGYSSGRLDALDLFDADHVLFEAQVAAARSQADRAIAVAELEGAIAAPIDFERLSGDSRQQENDR